MQLPEKAMLRRYNALANDWTPLSRKPCWLSNAFHCKDNYMKRNRFAWFRLPILSTQIPSADNKLHCACDKSFADDLVPSRYCKRESNLCITIRWGFCGVSSICSSLIFQYNLWWLGRRVRFEPSSSFQNFIMDSSEILLSRFSCRNDRSEIKFGFKNFFSKSTSRFDRSKNFPFSSCIQRWLMEFD